jgi:preprotein translocase subunit SecF
MRPLRLVPDNTNIRFMRGRLAGPLVSAVLSIASLILFFVPGLNYGIDFRGGVVMELRLPQEPDLAALRAGFEGLHLGEVKLQSFGGSHDVRVSLDQRAANEDAKGAMRDMLARNFSGTEVRSIEVIGARVSQELFTHGLLASAAALGAVLLYIWFRFDWHFGIGVVATLLLDLTKTIGFLALTQLQFDLNSVAAILMLIGYSVTDKVVVYDRIRENLRKYPTMALRELIDRSINQTLGRTVATSLTVLLSILPLALIGGESIRDFAVIIIFGIVVGTSSSIFIAAPILLYLGRNSLGGKVRPQNLAEESATA